MTAQRDMTAQNIGQTLDLMARNLDALHYLNQLLDLAINADGGALADPHSGLSALMECQLDGLGDGIEALRTIPQHNMGQDMPQETAPTPVPQPKITDLKTIAHRARVRPEEAARVIFVLSGEDLAGASYRPADGAPYHSLPVHLLSALIWDSLSHGAALGTVSTQLKMEIVDLERVLRAVVAYLPHVRHEELRTGTKASETLETDQPEASNALPEAEKMRGAISWIAGETNLPTEVVARVVERLVSDAEDTPENTREIGAPATKSPRQKKVQ